jgi:hypothetical protein
MSEHNGSQRPEDRRGDGFAELDALVRAELNALDRARRHRPDRPETKHAPEPRDARRRDNVIVARRWRTDEPQPAHDDGCCDDDGPFDAAVMQSPDNDEPLDLAFDEAAESGEDDVFTLEERTFIDRAVKWLTPRENKDLIVSRIWARLTDAEPGTFFDADADATGDAETDEEADAASTPDEPEGAPPPARITQAKRATPREAPPAPPQLPPELPPDSPPHLSAQAPARSSEDRPRAAPGPSDAADAAPAPDAGSSRGESASPDGGHGGD